MAETEMWDGKRPTRTLLARRTLSWGPAFPVRAQYKDGELFLRTDLKSIYKYNLSVGSYEDMILGEEENIATVLALG